jgi:limonene-1,2-epoxide hydrolase
MHGITAPTTGLLAAGLVTYQRHDGSRVTLPCFNVFRLRDARIADYRIYVDANPVFAAEGA